MPLTPTSGSSGSDWASTLFKAPADSSGSDSDFKAPAEPARRLRWAYLRRLNKHPPFALALGRLFAQLSQLPQAPLPSVWKGELASAEASHARACRQAVADAGARVQASLERLRHLQALLAEAAEQAGGASPASASASVSVSVSANPWTRPAAAYELWFTLREGRDWLWQAWLRLGEAWRALHRAVARRLVVDFCQSFPLPTRPTGAEHDVWHSFQMWRLARPERRRAELIPGPWMASVPTPGTLVVVEEIEMEEVEGNDLPEGPGFGAGAGAGAGGGVRIRSVTKIPVIVPNCPLPFLWDPVHEGRQVLAEHLEALLADIRESVLAQAEALEAQVEAAGWRKPPHRTPDFALRAERLFRRVVLKQSWDQIRRYTGATNPHARYLVRRQVLDDAKLLGISLP